MPVYKVDVQWTEGDSFKIDASTPKEAAEIAEGKVSCSGGHICDSLQIFIDGKEYTGEDEDDEEEIEVDIDYGEEGDE